MDQVKGELRCPLACPSQSESIHWYNWTRRVEMVEMDEKWRES